MYTVTFNDGSTRLMKDEKAEKILLFQRQGILNERQKRYLSHVRSIEHKREKVDEHRIHLTKDIFDSKCRQKANYR